MAGHPLDPLSPDEIRQAADVCRLYAKQEGVEALRFNVITLQEPRKVQLLAYGKDPSNVTLPRRTFCILQLPGLSGVVEAELAVFRSNPRLGRITQVEGVHALASPDDCFEAEAIAKADPRVVQLLRERYGVMDLELVCCDPWSIHASPLEERAIQCFMYLKTCPEDNAYAHPLDFVPIVSMDSRTVVRIDLPYKGPTVEWNKENNNYHTALQKEIRTDLKPINIVQPEGPSFTVEGQLIRWHNWSLRLGFNYREGIVLHDLRYRNEGRERPVMHRLSLVEMAVPYADPRYPYVRKCAFDVGDYGLGYCTFPLALGCDCLGHIHYFDVTLSNSKGEPVTLPKAVCMHEEDTGLLYKHVDYRTGHAESRRGRRLVLSHIATVVNYEYAFYWYLYLDGTIGLDIKLTGELSTNMVSPGENPAAPQHGTLVGPNGVNAQHHQHMFCARLDAAVDDEEGGKELVVKEVDVESMPWDGLTNPYGNGFRTVETPLTSVHQAQRSIAPEKGRVWKFVNPRVINPITRTPVAYKLVPAAHPPLAAQPGSLIAHKGHFATKQLWVTPWPAGSYVFGAKQCTGLADWTEEDWSLEGSDPVVWYSFGVTHIVRPEDFPIMPVEVCVRVLKPSGFFTRNPCLDLPYNKNTASVDNHSTAVAVNGNNTGNGKGTCCGAS
ncbi:copper amine oxidase [Volvox carteri f. nagariensis]|uniref:Amine oxidase n=1 Tax=Volvox carteri f. nagariensis TaxID=3068 RepID=D8UKB9_VOLCA|nr:copper amine oxidase [Volvox carteri f. nagariensis]EFJ39825.1 copper amine oxidase [Volvox carteri f. nagariensis]|eukprot:XP_002959097.1 copper amine oxidase [Volvox carteri f. nagariensis]